MMTGRSRRTEGFTITEIVFAGTLFTLVLGTVIGTFTQAKYMQRDSETESDLSTSGLTVMDRIERGDRGLQGLMKARSGSIAPLNGGTRIDFEIDTNTLYSNTFADDTPMSIYFDNGDGDDSTIDDNTVIFDPNRGGSSGGHSNDDRQEC